MLNYKDCLRVDTAEEIQDTFEFGGIFNYFLVSVTRGFAAVNERQPCHSTG